VTAAAWAALALVTGLLVVMTWQVLTHDPSVCRECVDKAARECRPSGWGSRP
jgi:hypothetical protein